MVWSEIWPRAVAKPLRAVALRHGARRSVAVAGRWPSCGARELRGGARYVAKPWHTTDARRWPVLWPSGDDARAPSRGRRWRARSARLAVAARRRASAQPRIRVNHSMVWSEIWPRGARCAVAWRWRAVAWRWRAVARRWPSGRRAVASCGARGERAVACAVAERRRRASAQPKIRVNHSMVWSKIWGRGARLAREARARRSGAVARPSRGGRWAVALRGGLCCGLAVALRAKRALCGCAVAWRWPSCGAP